MSHQKPRIFRVGRKMVAVDCGCGTEPKKARKKVKEAVAKRRKRATPKRRKVAKRTPKRAAAPKRRKRATPKRRVAKRRAAKRTTKRKAGKRKARRGSAPRLPGGGTVVLLMGPDASPRLVSGPQPIGLLPPAPRVVDAQIVPSGGGGPSRGRGGRRGRGKGTQMNLGGIQ